MRLYTRYRPTRARNRPWRLWLALALLGASLYAWLRWQPPAPIQPQQLLLSAIDNRPQTNSTAPAAPAPGGPSTSDTTPGAKGDRHPARTGNVQPVSTASTTTPASAPAEDRPVETLFEAQLALARLGLSPGSIDGVLGSRTRNALRVLQQRERLRVTGELDAATRQRLRLRHQPYTNYTVTSDDLARLLPVGSGWLAKSQQSRLDYATLLELVAERSWSHPDFIRKLNPLVDWNQVAPGARLLVPNPSPPEPGSKAALVRIQLNNRFLQVFDERVNLIAHFPCTIARSVDRRPIGELRVDVLISMPNYTFDPARFTPTPETRGIDTKLILPPGPNNPVGTVWIGLNRPGYGIHGTPEPEKVGAAESLGCFRLANWNAELLLKLAWVGMPVHVEP